MLVLLPVALFGQEEEGEASDAVVCSTKVAST